MAGEEYYVPQVDGDSIESVRDSINESLSELNTILRTIETRQAQIAGERGFTPKFSNHVNMQGYRVTNAGRSRRPEDLVTRRELQDQGLYQPNPGRALVAKMPIVAQGGVFIPRGAGGGGRSDAVPTAGELTTAVDQLQSQVNIAAGDIVALTDTLETLEGLAFRSTEVFEFLLDEVRVMRTQLEQVTGEEFSRADVKELE